jgi:hypothetical protein
MDDVILKRSVDLLNSIKDIEDRRSEDGISHFDVSTLGSRAAQLIHAVSGPKSVYAENLRSSLKEKVPTYRFHSIAGVVQAFHLDLASGYLANLRHEVESVVVSEILTQARVLLGTRGVHPASAVLVACAGLEEFLRNWCEERKLSVPPKQRSLSRFAQALRAADCITLPVERRIQSWADYRNSAAHGSGWAKITEGIAAKLVEEVSDFVADNTRVIT